MVAQITVKTTKPIPGIRELPLIGSLHTHNTDRLNLYLRVMHECGDIGQFHYGPYPLVQINAPELVHKVLVEQAYEFEKGEFIHRAFDPILGLGLFTSEGDLHRKQRKLMAPSFQPRQIVSYADAMVNYGEQIQQGWRDGGTIAINQEMTHLTMSIVGKVLFDADIFTETDDLGAAMTEILSFVNYTLSRFFPVPLDWPMPRSRRARQGLATLDKRIQKMIEERRSSSEERDDLLSVLLKAKEEDGRAMSDKQLRDESLTLFAAGHETTATALTWVWYLLATHPDCYQKLLQEVDTVLQRRRPTYADLAHLPYSLQVFKEALRMYPPAYAMTRVALHDLEIAGYLVRKRQAVLIPMYAIHRRPDYYPDPEVFRPERFAPENEKELPRHAYMPFGAGARICIGNHFAMMEGHLLVTTLAQRVSFELVPGQHIEPDPTKTITIRPKHSIKMVMRRRNVA